MKNGIDSASNALDVARQIQKDLKSLGKSVRDPALKKAETDGYSKKGLEETKKEIDETVGRLEKRLERLQVAQALVDCEEGSIKKQDWDLAAKGCPEMKKPLSMRAIRRLLRPQDLLLLLEKAFPKDKIQALTEFQKFLSSQQRRWIEELTGSQLSPSENPDQEFVEFVFDKDFEVGRLQKLLVKQKLILCGVSEQILVSQSEQSLVSKVKGQLSISQMEELKKKLGGEPKSLEQLEEGIGAAEVARLMKNAFFPVESIREEWSSLGPEGQKALQEFIEKKVPDPSDVGTPAYKAFTRISAIMRAGDITLSQGKLVLNSSTGKKVISFPLELAAIATGIAKKGSSSEFMKAVVKHEFDRAFPQALNQYSSYIGPVLLDETEELWPEEQILGAPVALGEFPRGSL